MVEFLIMTGFRYIIGAACLGLSLGAIAAGPHWGDYAVVVCRAANLQVSAISASYETAANPSAGCAATLSALKKESLQLTQTQATMDHIVYTFEFFQML